MCENTDLNACASEDSRFQVPGFSFQVQVPGSRFQALGFRFQVPDARCLVSYFNVPVPGARCQVPGLTLQVPSFRFRIPGSRCQIPGSRFQVPGFRCQARGSEFRVPGSRFPIRVRGALEPGQAVAYSDENQTKTVPWHKRVKLVYFWCPRRARILGRPWNSTMRKLNRKSAFRAGKKLCIFLVAHRSQRCLGTLAGRGTLH